MWAQLGLNQRPPDYESGATNQLSYGPNENFSFVGQRYIFVCLLANIRLIFP